MLMNVPLEHTRACHHLESVQTPSAATLVRVSLVTLEMESIPAMVSYFHTLPLIPQSLRSAMKMVYLKQLENLPFSQLHILAYGYDNLYPLP